MPITIEGSGTSTNDTDHRTPLRSLGKVVDTSLSEFRLRATNRPWKVPVKSMLNRYLIVSLLVGLLCCSTWAQGPGHSWTVVLDANSGEVLEAVRHDRFAKHYPPNDKKLVLGSFGVPEEKAPSLTLPKQYKGRPVVAKPLRWNAKSVLTFLGYDGNLPPTNGRGEFVLLDRVSGQLITHLASCETNSAGRTTFYKPGVTHCQDFLAADQKDGTVALSSLLTGKKVGAFPGKLSDWNGGASGLWKANSAFYLATESILTASRGQPESTHLTKFKPGAGVLWKCDRIGPEVWRLKQEGGRVYVWFNGDPKEFELKKAAASRFSTQDIGTNVIPYKNLLFGATRLGGYDSPRIAIWEVLNGQWSFIFEYRKDKLSESQRDSLFQKHQFSPTMRARLETAFPP